MLLATSYQEIISFLCLAAADVQTVRPTLSVVGNGHAVLLQIAYQFVQLSLILGLGTVLG